ncbi:hypothetical protein [Planktothricoides raciborskii]|uniref:Tetratricopeptide repeat protein n=1 Tax=Planktothricoides raciborskii GIHE-MW2 TaxID=2792601 RepID=A0AAU8JAQ3_9CYAN
MSVPELEAAIQRYDAAIADIESRIQTAAIVQAKLVRDAVLGDAVKSATRDALNSKAEKFDLPQVVPQATQQVMTEKSLEAIAAKIINLALNADGIDTEIDPTIQTAVATFAKELSQEITHEQILEVLTARDGVQWALSQETPVLTGKLLAQLKRGDRYLKSPQWQTLISLINLDEWREMFHPPQTAWWWYCEPKPSAPTPKRFSFWDWLDLPCNLLTWFFLTISVSLVGDMAAQVFAGDSDNALGIFALISPTVLTFFSGKQALTQKGKEDIQIWLESWKIHKKYVHEVSAVISLFLCGFILIFYKLLVPNIADYLGQKYEQAGELKAAQQKYELAVKFQYTPAYPKLARVLVEQGKPEYEAAEKTIREGLQVAQAKKDQPNLDATLVVLNKLARAYNLQKNTTNTIPLVAEGWKNSKGASDRVTYNLMTNYGWGYLNRENYNYALSWLESARDITNTLPELSKHPDHYCLLGIVYQQINQMPKNWQIYRENEKESWAKCIKFSSDETLEEIEWSKQGQTYLDMIEKTDKGVK